MQQKFRGTVDFSRGGALDVSLLEIREKTIYFIFEAQLEGSRWKGVAMLTKVNEVWQSSEFEMVMCSDSRVSAVTKIKLTQITVTDNELDLYGEMFFKNKEHRFDGVLDMDAQLVK